MWTVMFPCYYCHNLCSSQCWCNYRVLSLPTIHLCCCCCCMSFDRCRWQSTPFQLWSWLSTMPWWTFFMSSDLYCRLILLVSFSPSNCQLEFVLQVVWAKDRCKHRSLEKGLCWRMPLNCLSHVYPMHDPRGSKTKITFQNDRRDQNGGRGTRMPNTRSKNIFWLRTNLRKGRQTLTITGWL